MRRLLTYSKADTMDILNRAHPGYEADATLAAVKAAVAKGLPAEEAQIDTVRLICDWAAVSPVHDVMRAVALARSGGAGAASHAPASPGDAFGDAAGCLRRVFAVRLLQRLAAAAAKPPAPAAGAQCGPPLQGYV